MVHIATREKSSKMRVGGDVVTRKGQDNNTTPSNIGISRIIHHPLYLSFYSKDVLEKYHCEMQKGQFRVVIFRGVINRQNKENNSKT